MIYPIIIMGLFLFVIPIVVGGIFSFLDKDRVNLPFRWVCGQICLWAGFQFVCVPVILRGKQTGFSIVCTAYMFFVAALLLVSAGVLIKRRAYYGVAKKEKAPEHQKDSISVLLWVLAILVIAVQVVLSATLAYEEGDDAFYVATSTITVSSDEMYKILPYTGGTTGLDMRHGLAPFPIWIAMLAKFTHLHPATVAQIALPTIFIAMSYIIYYLLGRKLFVNSVRRLPLFLLFLGTLVLFGGYSLYSAENFMLVRTAQGKSVMANIIIPFIFVLLFALIQSLQQGERIHHQFWLLLGLTGVAGCLCSTQGALLTCILMAAAGLCIVMTYKSWKLLIPMSLCCVMPMCYAILYLVLEG